MIVTLSKHIPEHIGTSFLALLDNQSVNALFNGSADHLIQQLLFVQ